MPVEQKEEDCVTVKTLAEIRREKQQRTEVGGKWGPSTIFIEHRGPVIRASNYQSSEPS